MKFENISSTIPDWMSPEGPETEIVISSRARLARNIPGYAYVHRADDIKLGEITDAILDAAASAGFDPESFFRNGTLDEVQRSILIERHLISPAANANRERRGVLIREGECCSILVNEEDHLRIQSITSGFDPMKAWEEVDSADDRISRVIPFSFSRRYGYLTACPTNIGTGLRISILVHLPALVLTKDIQRLLRSTGQIGLTVRGYYGEGTDVVGNLFQISNHVSLGKSEREIVDELTTAAVKIVEYERRSAETLFREARTQLEDKIFRSVGILKSARVLSTNEFMNLSSAVRLGVMLHILSKPDVKTLNELVVITQPGHLQARRGRTVEATERDVIRADLVRERFIDVRV